MGQEFGQGIGFPGGSGGKESAFNAGDLDSLPGLGRSSGGGHGNSLQYSCLEYPHGQRSLLSYSPWGGKESQTTERLSQHSTSKLGILPWPPVKICSVFCFILLGFPDDSAGRESTCNAVDTRVISSIPGSRRFPGEGNGNLLQYSCLGNPMDRGA